MNEEGRLFSLVEGSLLDLCTGKWGKDQQREAPLGGLGDLVDRNRTVTPTSIGVDVVN